MVSSGRRAVLLGVLVALSACATHQRRFPLRAPMTHDPDMRPWGPMPQEYVSPMVWDGADKLVFLPLTNAFWIPLGRPATNVTALDEVPDSSWYTNRSLTPEEAARGFCGEPLDTSGPWTIKSGKPNGVNPGFIFKAQDGRKYVLKVDGVDQPERPTGADLIGSRLYYAAGYHASCNRVVYFDPAILQIAPDATSEDERGNERPFSTRDIENVVALAARGPGRTIRASTSEFLPGRPLGPFTYLGTLDEDPNDVIPHEDRREVRASYVLAALTSHFDCREQNTLDIWRETGRDLGYVEHHWLDWGDSFGSVFEPRQVARKLGHSHYFDIPQMAENILTLGAIRRPWEGRNDEHRLFGLYDVQHFEPDAWRPSYPNPAMSRMDEQDAHWAARKLAAIGPAHIRAIVREARFSNPDDERLLARTIIGRRVKLLRRYLLHWTPVASFRVQGRDVCFDDLATRAGLARSSVRPIAHRARTASRDLALHSDDQGLVCVTVPPGGGEYQVLSISARMAGEAEDLRPVDVHVYDLPGRGLVLAGIERDE
ncbi:MAG: hypothetical protein HYY06_18725 [Deltaproteobacteria bacterium]|nr:hypothetical protein [Deltaproteobacteria bacterium]